MLLTWKWNKQVSWFLVSISTVVDICRNKCRKLALKILTSIQLKPIGRFIPVATVLEHVYGTIATTWHSGHTSAHNSP